MDFEGVSCTTCCVEDSPLFELSGAHPFDCAKAMADIHRDSFSVKGLGTDASADVERQSMVVVESSTASPLPTMDSLQRHMRHHALGPLPK